MMMMRWSVMIFFICWLSVARDIPMESSPASFLINKCLLFIYFFGLRQIEMECKRVLPWRDNSNQNKFVLSYNSDIPISTYMKWLSFFTLRLTFLYSLSHLFTLGIGSDHRMWRGNDRRARGSVSNDFIYLCEREKTFS